MPLCSLQAAAWFRSCIPFLGLVSTIGCLYAVNKRPPLSAEFFSVTSRPVNGTLQVLRCTPAVGFQQGSQSLQCRLGVDTEQRLEVAAFRVHMGMLFVGCCSLGALFGMVAFKENAQYISSELLFTRDSYAPVEMRSFSHHDGSGGGGISLYSWELVWWGYIWALHIILVSCLTSPVDIFDTALVVGFSCTCLMFLCRPREGRDADGDHSSPAGPFPLVVAAVLITCVWLAMSSVPHVYESDRMWLLGILLGMDALMLFIHLSDTMPTMYTVLMGRLTYTVLANGILIYTYWVLPDRLQE